MRLFCFLFAFYLAGLACFFCTDPVDKRGDQVHPTIAAAHAGDGFGAVSDWCSPLCQCHACPGAVLPLAGTAPLPPPRQLGPKAPCLRVPLGETPTTRPQGAVWQPPRA